MPNLVLNDKIGMNDVIVNMPKAHRSGIYQKTRIIGGYDLKFDANGISSLGETTFDEENMIPIGGCQYSFEQLFGVAGPMNVPTLHTISGGTIGLADKNIADYSNAERKYFVPHMSGEPDSKNVVHPCGEFVCLFGVGITGSATNILTKPSVSYQEYAIQNSLAVEDGHEMTGVMIPLRYTENKLSDTDAVKYFGKTKKWTSSNTEKIGYYLKRFENDPTIKHFWKAASDETESTNAVSQNEYYPRENTANSSTIESYVEMVLKISPKDVKEWFDATDNIDNARINTIALFTGRYNPDTEKKNDKGDDYENVRLFSKLTFKVTALDITKDFTIIYRIYSS